MTFLDTGRAAKDPEFNLRVTSCLYKLAQDVLNEGDAPEHAVRAQLAKAVIAQPMQLTDRFSWLCASNPAVSATVTVVDGEVEVGAPDGDLEFVCASNWTIVATWYAGLVGAALSP